MPKLGVSMGDVANIRQSEVLEALFFVVYQNQRHSQLMSEIRGYKNRSYQGVDASAPCSPSFDPRHASRYWLVGIQRSDLLFQVRTH